MITNRRLASYVHSLTIRDMYGYYEDLISVGHDEDVDEEYERKGWPDHPDLASILRQSVSRMIPETAIEGLIEAVYEAATEEPILALLLTNLPNIRRLDLPIADEGVEFASVIRHIAERKRREGSDDLPLQKLTDVMLYGTDDKYPDSPDMLGVILRLPNIRSIYAFNLGVHEATSISGYQEGVVETSPRFRELKPASSTVEEIELRHCKLLSADMIAMMRAARDLKTPIYDVGQSWAWIQLSTVKLASALLYQAHSLERLCLADTEYIPESFNDVLKPMNFHSLTTLKHLRITPVFVFGAKATSGFEDDDATTTTTDAQVIADFSYAFPTRLETLHFIRVEQEAVEYLERGLKALLPHRNTRLPQLHTLTIQGKLAARFGQAGSSVREEARANRVRLVIIKEFELDANGKRSQVPRGWGWDGNVAWETETSFPYQDLHRGVTNYDVM